MWARRVTEQRFTTEDHRGCRGSVRPAEEFCGGEDSQFFVLVLVLVIVLVIEDLNWQIAKTTTITSTITSTASLSTSTNVDCVAGEVPVFSVVK